MLLRVKDGTLKKKKKHKERLEKQIFRPGAERPIGAIATLQTRFVGLTWASKMTSDRRSAARPCQWEATVHVFSVEWVTFILSLTTLATEQTKNTSLLAERWRASGGCGVGREPANGVDTFHCERHDLFYRRTKCYSKSTSWSRCLTQFYYVPYAITWEKVCEIQDICVLC